MAITFSAPASAAPCTAFIPTRPEDGHRLAGPHACPVDGRTPAGRHRTADQAGAIEREIRIDLDHRIDGTDGVLAESRDECELGDIFAPLVMEAKRPIAMRALPDQNTAIAECCQPTQAPATLAAGGNGTEHDMVTRLDLADAGTDLFHDASTFVPDDHGKANRSLSLGEVPIGKAQSGGHELVQHFSLFRLVDVDLLAGERAGRAVQDRGAGLYRTPPLL